MSTYLLALPDGAAIPYHLERRSRKTVGMRISPDGLIVHAPKRISQSQLEHLLRTKADWIRKKLEALQNSAVAPTQWQDGTALLLLGNDITLSVKHDARNRALEYQPGILQVALPTPQDEASIARKVLQWYRRQALTDFGRRLEILSAKLGVPTPPLFLSNARTRWGSCNSRGEVRLNWRLLQAPPHIINYVICHELAHLKQMNHSAKFWALVEKICPDYKRAEKELKSLSAQLHAMS